MIRKHWILVAATAALVASGAAAQAAVSQAGVGIVDGAPVVYSNGGGSGFGGTLGGGSFSLQVVGSDLVVRFTPSGGFNGNAVGFFIDSQQGGLLDIDLTDVGDQGRRTLSQPSRDTNVAWPGTGVTADDTVRPEFGITFADFGAASFALTTGSLQFQTFTAPTDGDPSRVNTIPLASLGLSPTGGTLNFWAMLTSGDSFLSNETLPAVSGNAGGNPGYEGAFGVENYNSFTYVVPEPASMSLLALPAAALLRRRRETFGRGVSGDMR